MNKKEIRLWFLATPVLVLLAILVVIFFAIWDFQKKFVSELKSIVFTMIGEILSDMTSTMKRLTGNS
ncbi:MAG: hypothetical protein WCT19_00460 [Candidatus Paceibacterota bacterium]|jgi:hypothetical protein